MKKTYNIKWCKKCVLPNTRPNLTILKNGICSICSLKKEKINWKFRFKFLKNLSKKLRKDQKIIMIV